MRNALAALAPAAGWLLSAPAHAQQAEPFHIRNLNPLIAIFGLPAWDTVRPGSRFDATVEIANDYRLSMSNGDLLILDGETVRTTLGYSRSVGERWSVGAEAPYYRVSGGVLDDVIDGWHSAFGLPDGGRNARPEGELLFMLGNSNGRFFRLDSPRGGWGDAQLKVARKVGARNRFVLQGSVKLPTGEQEMLAGSGSADWSVTLLRSQDLPARSRPAGYYWGVGLVRAGEPEQIDFRAKTWVYTAVIGGSWQPWRRTGLKAQLDFNTPFYDSPLEEIGETAIQATAGAWWRAGRRASLELALVEDLEVSTSPDVVVHFAAHWRW
ncbi:MAG TPA: DUF3187 family protein [Gammaproteobacteria bacterium]|nr:DUF3187 family protein [Gammaproteobacteria bacterium]